MSPQSTPSSSRQSPNQISSPPGQTPQTNASPILDRDINRILPIRDLSPSPYDPRRVSSTPTSPVYPSATAMLPTASAEGSSTGIGGSPRRGNSLRRKPVPTLHMPQPISYPLPNDRLPSNHPFANARPSPTGSPASAASTARTGRLEVPGVGAGAGRDTASSSRSRSGTPDSGTRRSTPPPPHRRVVSVGAPVIPPRSGSRGQPQDLLLIEQDEGILSSNDDVATQALQARLVSLSLDRPLPPVPQEGDSSQRRRRSLSADSPLLPTTPLEKTANFAPPPEIKILDPQNAPTGIAAGAMGGTKMSRETSSSRGRFFRKDHSDKNKKDEKKSKASTAVGVNELEDEEFDVNRIPSKRRLWEAGTCFLKDEEGQLVCFGDFFPRWEDSTTVTTDDLHQQHQTNSATLEINDSTTFMEKSTSEDPAHNASRPTTSKTPVHKTVIFFIRHFWCGQCQDYTFASLSLLDPVALEKAGIRVVIVSNGSWKMIKAYRRLFKCPFPIYVDGPRRLYQLMGMTKMTNDFGPLFKGRAAYHQRNVPGQLVQSLTNAFRMPFANPGTITQLGGEFVLSPGWNCDFAHRMTTTSDHMEAPDVLRLAGCEHPTKSEVSAVELAESQREELEKLEKEMNDWRDRRKKELERIQMKKASRRGLPYRPSRQNSGISIGLDTEIGENNDKDVVNENARKKVEAENDLQWAEEQEQFEVDKDQLDARFERVMREEEERAKERVAAGRLMLARGKGDLEVEVERESKQ
ncbi:hypothetical protein CI109_106788 [Kwoniella shandongensis]|uniref:Uncharacterized protein n=1 Tax=Kwoniella shandongensis TaxID=1734106 RepID=A0A5M6CBI1_9TREE|nr:uncharacterized protein CI109_000955 [Kwoniella shandongensis]KAA5530775.1 hypothetical protein CI109_000955 [Kwoniella shandongensis]